MRLRGVGALLLACGLILGGCAGDAPPAPKTAAAPAAEADGPGPGSGPGSGPGPVGAGLGTIPQFESERWQAARPAKSANPAETPVPALTSLAGLDDIKIMALLGAPHFKRTDAPAELWQYRLNGCVLDLFLYPASGGGLAVDHLETRVLESESAPPTGPRSGDGQACFAAMVRAARASPS